MGKNQGVVMFFKNSEQVVLSTLLAVMILSTTTLAMAENVNRYITVTGKGEVSAVPDTAWVTSGVNTQAKTAAEALNKNTNLMKAVIGVFKDSDIKDKNIQTSGFNVHPVYDYSKDSSPPKLTGYRVSNSVTVKITDINKLGELLDKLVSSGSNQISGIRFGFDDNKALLDEARKDAIANTRKKAQLYAQAAGVDVGDVVSINELGTRLPRLVYRRTEMDQAKMMTSSGSVPVMSGEQSISASVTVVYELKD
jgi:uncharacterized protein YggE